MKCVFLLQRILIIFWNGHWLYAPTVTSLGQQTKYGPNPPVKLFSNEDLGHKIVAKSADMKTLPNGDGMDTKDFSRSSFHYHEGRGEGSSGSRKLSSESAAVSNANGAAEDGEEEILQEIIAARRDAMRFRVRNSSELHVDNHNENSEPTPKPSLSDPLVNVVVLPKPFHFHIPIIWNPAPAKQKQPESERKVTVKKMVSLQAQSTKLKRGKDDSEFLQEEVVASSSEENPRRASVAPLANSNGGIGKRNIAPSSHSHLNKEEVAAPASSIDNRFHALRNPKIERDSSELRMISDLDALINQHPKLIPPVNRKRNSGHSEKQDALDEETHHYMVVFKREQNKDDLELPQDEVKMTALKKEVKTMNFSQGVVDSILGHEDDLIKYRNNIQSHAQKLGVEPHEVFRKVVYGNSSNEPYKKETNSTALEIQQRRHQFQQLFLGNGDDVGKHGNEIPHEEQEQSVSSDDNRYSAYMKILRREKRGLKSWFKKLFKKGDNPEDKERTTTRASTTRAPKKKYSSVEDHDYVHKPKKTKTFYHQDVDKQGNTAVDLLLPESLRRSSYMKKKQEINSRAREDEEIEEEEEKSEEKEVKTRNADDDEPESGRKEKKKDKKKKRVHKRSPTTDDPITPIAENMGDGKLTRLSKDEILLIHEMLLNIINFRCGEISRSIIDNLLSITQIVIGMSALPGYISDRRQKVDSLFDQILSCSSNEENFARWGSGRQQGKGLGLSDVPHKRIKRIRRRRNEIAKEEDHDDKLKSLSELSEAHKASPSGGTIILKLMKLHVLIYKLILEICWEVVDPQLLHDAQLILVEEFIRISKTEKNKNEVEDYASRIDAASVEQMFQECYSRKE